MFRAMTLCLGLTLALIPAVARAQVPPTMTAAFGGTTVPLNGTTTLSFTITNPNAAAALTNIGLNDFLPFGLVVSTPNGVTGSCGLGVLTANAGSTQATLSGGTLASSSSCTVGLNVTGTSVGTRFNTAGPVTSSAGTGNTFSGQIVVVPPPNISKNFGTFSLYRGASTSLSISVVNNSNSNLTGVSFTDPLPAGLLVSTPNGLVSSCVGTATAAADSGTVSLTGGTLPSFNACSITVSVTGVIPGQQNNVTSVVSSTEGGDGGVARATINVLCATDPDCSATPTTPACQANGTCGQCNAGNVSTCVFPNPACFTATGTCGCQLDSQCGPTDSGYLCNGTPGTCLPGCSTTPGRNNCPPTQYCSDLGGDAGTCLSQPCNSDSDCTTPPLNRCNLASVPHACIQCNVDGDCASGTVCNSSGVCVQCEPWRADKLCQASGSGAFCLASGSCGCEKDSDCGDVKSARVCNSATGQCQGGCRGTGGNGCPAGQGCTTSGGEFGTCAALPADAGRPTPTGGNGWSNGCASGSGGSPASGAVLALVGLLVLVRLRGRGRA